MLKLVLTVRRKPGISHEEFKNYYENHHRKLARYVAPYMLDYRRSYPVPTLTRLVQPYDPGHSAEAASAPFDALSEVWFSDENDLKSLFSVISENRSIWEEDENQFMDRSSMVMTVCEEHDICEDLGKLENSTTLAGGGRSALG